MNLYVSHKSPSSPHPPSPSPHPPSPSPHPSPPPLPPSPRPLIPFLLTLFPSPPFPSPPLKRYVVCKRFSFLQVDIPNDSFPPTNRGDKILLIRKSLCERFFRLNRVNKMGNLCGSCCKDSSEPDLITPDAVSSMLLR